MTSTKKVAQVKPKGKSVVKKKTAVSSRLSKTKQKKVQKKRKKTSVKNNTVSPKVVIKNKRNTQLKNTSQVLQVTKRIPYLSAFFTVVKFPVHADVFVIQTARISGLAVLVLGAAFTLLYSHYIWNASSTNIGLAQGQMLGSVIKVCDVSNGYTEFEQCIEHNILESQSQGMTSSSQTNSSSQSSTSSNSQNNSELVTQPPVTFNIQGNEPLSGDVSILIDVEAADKVDILVFKESYTTPLPLGLATQIQPNVWEYAWDTTQFDDAKYKVAADVTNVYTIGEPYRDSDNKYLQVANTTVAESGETTATTSIDIDETPDVELSLVSSNPVSNIADFKIKVLDADTVTLFSKHISSESSNVIGYATKTADDVWEYSWDTTEYTDGEYKIYTKIKNEYGTYKDGKVEITVLNNESVIDESDSEIMTPVEESEEKIPEASVTIKKSGTLSGVVDIQVDIDATKFVELWVVSEGSTIERIIGLATRDDLNSDTWSYSLNTHNIPNGSYSLFARVKNKFGVYRSEREYIKVFNKPFKQNLSQEQEQELKDIEIAQAIELDILEEINDVADEKRKKDEEHKDKDDTQEVDTPPSVKTRDTEGHQMDRILKAFSKDIESEITRLTTAYRSKDSDRIARAEQRIERLKREISDSVIGDARTDKLLTDINNEIDTIVSDRKILTQKVEKLITERVGDDVFKDSDSDGVSNYDERTIYNTDPYSADSDGDGFNDGAEITEGYDPLDSKREAAVVYESPKESGVVREDILVVESIVALVPEEPEYDKDGVASQAVISGKALPNSFITLYVFSVPTVVTVKTEADGSWQYRFDKELEDGVHQVYVGVTDNAGRIVAKSEPFTFVKEAQAFTPVDTSVLGSLSNQPIESDSLLSSYMIYLILSISVVSIGLVLILLGLHLETRQRRLLGVVNTDEES